MLGRWIIDKRASLFTKGEIRSDVIGQAHSPANGVSLLSRDPNPGSIEISREVWLNTCRSYGINSLHLPISNPSSRVDEELPVDKETCEPDPAWVLLYVYSCLFLILIVVSLASKSRRAMSNDIAQNLSYDRRTGSLLFVNKSRRRWSNWDLIDVSCRSGYHWRHLTSV